MITVYHRDVKTFVKENYRVGNIKCEKDQRYRTISYVTH